MQAHEDGKAVEIRANGSEGWNEMATGQPQWDWSGIDYRIKAEPFVRYVVISQNRNVLTTFRDKDSAIQQAQSLSSNSTRFTYTVRKMVEDTSYMGE